MLRVIVVLGILGAAASAVEGRAELAYVGSPSGSNGPGATARRRWPAAS